MLFSLRPSVMPLVLPSTMKPVKALLVLAVALRG
jgi:hypothetical protein